MTIKNVQVRKYETEGSPIRGFATVNFDLENGLELGITDISVIEGKDGLFASMPQRQYEKDGEKKYANKVFFTSGEDTTAAKEAYAELTKAVIEAYEAL